MQTKRKITAALVFSLLWMSWVGCMSPAKLRSKCMLLYPATDSVSEVVRYLPGETRIITQQVTVDCDSAIRAAAQPVANSDGTKTRRPVMVTVPCPPATIRVDTVERSIKVVKTDKAKEQALTAANQKLTIDLTITRKHLHTCLWVIGIFTLYSILKLVVRIYGRKLSWLAKLSKLFT